jgi:hypothetical protein
MGFDPRARTDVTFTGSSCVMLLEDPPEVSVHAKKRGEEVIRFEVELPEREREVGGGDEV